MNVERCFIFIFCCAPRPQRLVHFIDFSSFFESGSYAMLFTHRYVSGFFRASGRSMGKKRLWVTALWMVVIIPSFSLALCLDISDVPMDTQLQAAPASIMFVIDDSGSMDWEFMTPESSGIFHGEYYNFDLGSGTDNAYSDSYILEGSEKRLWQGRWSGYNKMYYNPAANYKPWPGHSNADTAVPRSNPINADPTLTLSDEYDSIETGVIVDNTDPEFTSSTTGWDATTASTDYGSDYLYTSGNADGTAWARWTVDVPALGNYEVFGWWRDYSGDRVTTVTYDIFHNGTLTEDVAFRRRGS